MMFVISIPNVFTTKTSKRIAKNHSLNVLFVFSVIFGNDYSMNLNFDRLLWIIMLDFRFWIAD
jgi:hypothetical protein